MVGYPRTPGVAVHPQLSGAVLLVVVVVRGPWAVAGPQLALWRLFCTSLQGMSPCVCEGGEGGVSPTLRVVPRQVCSCCMGRPVLRQRLRTLYLCTGGW